MYHSIAAQKRLDCSLARFDLRRHQRVNLPTTLVATHATNAVAVKRGDTGERTDEAIRRLTCASLVVVPATGEHFLERLELGIE